MHAFFLFFCINAFIILPAWADVMQGAFCVQQYPPSVSLAACSKEAGPLCLCQPPSLAPFVKKWTNWSAQARHSHMEESTSPGRRRRSLEVGMQEAGGALGEGGGTEDERVMNSWAIHCPVSSPPPFLPSRATPLYCRSPLLLNGDWPFAEELLAAEGPAAPAALTHARSSEGDIFQERLQLPVLPLGFPAPKWSRTPPSKISLCTPVVDSALLLLLSIYYPCQGGGPGLLFK